MSNFDCSPTNQIGVLLDRWQAELPEQPRSLIDSVLSGQRPCYVFGRNPNSEFMAKYLPLQGFVDDYAEPETFWLDLPVLRGEVVPADSVIVNAVLLRRPHQALARLQELPQQIHPLHYGDFMRYNPVSFPALPFVEQARSIFYTHKSEFDALSRSFIDDESRQVLHDVLMFRLTSDPIFTSQYQLRDQEQYFDVSLRLPLHPVFVDGGSYCGETTLLFCQKYSEYGRVYLFEPNPASLEKARNQLRDYRDIHFYGYALGDQRDTLAFDAMSANASRITTNGLNQVHVVPLDEIVDGSINFIKYDLEGYEPKALTGALHTIQRNHPVLAVCVYHHPMDFLDVPRTVRRSGIDYALRLRHYTEGWEETVMYFEPMN